MDFDIKGLKGLEGDLADDILSTPIDMECPSCGNKVIVSVKNPNCPKCGYEFSIEVA